MSVQTPLTPVLLEQRSLASAMRSPRSIGLLLVALIVAATCAGLGQWQLERATQAGTVVVRPTERVVPLTRIARPQAAQDAASVGQIVAVRGTFVPGDFGVIGDRLNFGRNGYWVTGHLLTTDPSGAQLAVGVGWAPDLATARAAAARLNGQPHPPADYTGRYVDSDPPTNSDDTPGDDGSAVGARTTDVPQVMSVPQLLNIWHADTSGPVYAGYLTLRHALGGLATIDSPAPNQQVELNLLNLFYSFEWALFAVIAFYVWYRLVRDRWEQDMDAALGITDPDPAE